MTVKFAILRSASLAALAMLSATPLIAQEADSGSVTGDERTQSSQDIVVQGQIGYRNRVETTEPVLVYDTDYFQRFEPLTAGDALKRVPSVTFLSDVIESDGARLRGLPPGYTQILINGERVPGSNADRSFFLDRVPAELISRVEIVRASSARRTGDAVAGTLNIVLRDALQLDGGYMRGGFLAFDDGEFEPSLGAVWGGEVGPGRLLLGANLQGRHNPKIKTSFRYGDSPENNPNFATDDFDNREDQVDTRDGTDYSFNASYQIDGETTDFSLNAFFVQTDRVEDERSFEYDDVTAINGPVRRTTPGNLTVDNANVANIDQLSFSVDAKLEHEWALGETTVKVGISRFDEDRIETEYEVEFDRSSPRFTGDLTQTDIADREISARLDHEFELGEDMELVVGGYFQDKDRSTDISDAVRSRFNLPVTVRDSYNQFQINPTIFSSPLTPTVAPAGGFNNIQEQRYDVFALIEGESGIFSYEAGVRWENTDLTITDFTVAPADQEQDNSYDLILPSASLKIDLTAVDRITASVARTNRRPDFNFISPAQLVEELGDNDLVGNSQLEPETAWGLDIGYERRLGRTGVVGVNFFYRDVTNLIELATIGTTPRGVLLQPINIDDGKVYGVEFDLSTDLGFIGLPDTGVFGNFSYLDSEVTDDFGPRRFNDQSEYVYNFGLIQNIPSFGAAFGATYRKQGSAFGRVVSEEVTTTYGGDLEVFIEKRFGNNLTIRAVGSNLLDGTKDEVFNKFNTLEEQADREFDEYELESERAGPVFQVIVRFAF